MLLSESTSPRLTSTGTGSPEGAVTANVGQVHVQTDASPTWTGIWYKASGTGNTGWVQITDADLVAIANLTSAANKLPYYTGAGAAALADFTAAGRALVDDADAAAQRTTLGLGTAATISSTAGGDLTGTLPSPTIATDAVTTAKIINDAVTYAKIQNVSATDKLLGRSTAGAGDVEEITCTAAGRALIDDAAASNQRTTLGLGTVATLASDTDGTLAANSDSVVATQKATKTYVDATVASGTVADGDKGDIVVSSSGTVWSFDTGVVTAFAKTMLDDAAASNVRTTLGLGSAALISSTAGGDLAGTLPSPTVAKITETSGPTTLTIGTIADGEYLKRSGTTLISGAPSGSGAPSNVDYLVKTADGGLSAERVVTDTTSITVDWGTAGQAKIQREALTGDVTASQNSNATTIASAAVTLAKMANLAQDQFIGRTTASTGVPETATITAAARTVLDDTTTGAMLTTLGTIAHAILYDSTLGGTATNIDTGASGIAGGYNVLDVYLLLRTDQAVADSSFLLRFNNDSSAIYDWQFVRGVNNTASASTGLAQTSINPNCAGASCASGVFSLYHLTVPCYAQTTANKTGEFVGGKADSTAANCRAEAQLVAWRSTAAITRMAVTAGASANFIAGSRMLIYGR